MKNQVKTLFSISKFAIKSTIGAATLFAALIPMVAQNPGTLPDINLSRSPEGHDMGKAKPAYVKWVAGGQYDQQSATTGQHSGLVPWGPPTVQDDNLATWAKKIRTKKNPADFIWVFTQCFGAGMFDELNALKGTQSGVSASEFAQTSNRPVSVANGGNNTDFVQAYLNALQAGVAKAKPLAATASRNDPWGPSPVTIPARGVEVMGTEQPVYFSTGAAADNLKAVPPLPGGLGLAVLWAGNPDGWDRDQLAQSIDLLCAGGYTGSQIFVLYGKGQVSGPASGAPNAIATSMMNCGGGATPVPQDHLRTASWKQLLILLKRFKLPQWGFPQQVFFFADDHGWNSAFGAVDKDTNGYQDERNAQDPDMDNPEATWGAGDSSEVPTD
jgi:hypothetical protein